MPDKFQYTGFTATKRQRQFNELENAGSEIFYRCIDCRNCGKCKNGEQIELISVQEEVEQGIINKSVTVDVRIGKTIAYH